MRAVGLMTHGGPEVLEVVDVPETHAGPGQVRLRVQAAAVNPTDTMARNGSRAPPYAGDGVYGPWNWSAVSADRPMAYRSSANSHRVSSTLPPRMSGARRCNRRIWRQSTCLTWRKVGAVLSTIAWSWQ